MGYWLWNSYTLILLVNGVFSLALAAYIHRTRSDRIGWSLVGLLLGVTVWSLADAFRLAAPSEMAILALNQVTYVGVALIPPSVVLFTAAYTDRPQWFRRRRLAALAAISVVMVLTVFTNPIHGLWRVSETVWPGTTPPVLSEEFGPIHVLWIAYVLLFATPVSYAMLLRSFWSHPHSGVFRQQVALILGSFTVPYVAASLYVTGLSPVDATPFGFLMTGIGLSVAVSRYRLLDIVPIARATVLENMDSGVLVLDTDDNVVDVNGTALEILEMDESNVVGTPLRDIVTDLPSEANRLLDTEETSRNIAVVDGDRTIHYDVTISPLRDGDRDLGRVVIFSDVTDRIRRQERLAAQKERLERQNERLDDFASLVSHDLRNPMQVVSSAVTLARETDDVSHLDRAESSLERMDGIIEDLLALSRAGSDDERRPISLDVVVREAWENTQTEGCSLEMEQELSTVEGNHGQLLHLFENLFRNAVEHNDTPVTVAVASLPDGIVAVEDDGTGIPADERDSVFEHGHTTSDEGTGFGLSIVQHIADAHGWDVSVHDGDSGGARFELRETSA